MSTQEVFVQQFAKLFGHYSDALEPGSELENRRQLIGWSDLPAADRNRMVAAARLALLELETTSLMEDDSRCYYAKPGEAEWGC